MDIVSKPNNDRHFLSFSRKLFLSVISLFLIFAACFSAYQYQREKEYKVELLDTQLQDYNDRLHQELRSNQFHSFNLLFVKKKVHLLNHVITSFFSF